MVETRLIPEDTYKNLTQKHNLIGIVRNLFSPMDSPDEYERLLQQVIEMRQGFVALQPEMMKEISDSLIRNLPVLLVRDYSGSLGPSFLRLRNVKTRKSGFTALQEVMQDEATPKEIKNALCQVEKERILLNMQVSILHTIIKQLRECKTKIEQVNQLT